LKPSGHWLDAGDQKSQEELSVDLSNHASADGTAAFANRETQAFFHRDWRNQSHFD
jgi:hypothetical protein